VALAFNDTRARDHKERVLAAECEITDLDAVVHKKRISNGKWRMANLKW
jgi:hypothetical protein